MTRIGYVKPQMFSTTYEALTQPPNFGFRLRPLSSSRLRSTARFCIPLHRLGAGAFLGLVPFSAIIVRRAEQASTPVASRPQVFATSRQDRRPQRLAGLFHPAGTPRVSVCRGHDLIDRVLSPVPGSCVVVLFFMGSFRGRGRFPAAGRRATTRMATSPHPAPGRLATAGAHLELESTLERCSRAGLPHLAERFHPPDASAPLLTVSPSGLSSVASLGVAALPPSGLRPPWGSSLTTDGSSANGVPSLWEFLPSDSNFLLGPWDTEVIVSLRGPRHCHQYSDHPLRTPMEDRPEFGSSNLSATSSLIKEPTTQHRYSIPNADRSQALFCFFSPPLKPAPNRRYIQCIAPQTGAAIGRRGLPSTPRQVRRAPSERDALWQGGCSPRKPANKGPLPFPPQKQDQ
jgi:hypothetical protein